jgi:esterase/lipase superfamily enzyme
VRREWHEVRVPGTGVPGAVISYGHWGRPLLAFPAEQGSASDFERHGMVDAIADLIEAGRVKLYCADSFDADSWARYDLPLEERAQRHRQYESWVIDGVVPYLRGDCDGAAEIMTTGCSLGAYHAVNFALKRADLFPLTIGLSGNYDPSTWRAWGERGDAVYFNNPGDYVANADAATWTGCGHRCRSCWWSARGHGRRTRPGRCRRRAGSRRCCRVRESGANSTCGATTLRTTGHGGAAS